jgi:hypothetical protein
MSDSTRTDFEPPYMATLDQEREWMACFNAEALASAETFGHRFYLKVARMSEGGAFHYAVKDRSTDRIVDLCEDLTSALDAADRLEERS